MKVARFYEPGDLRIGEMPAARGLWASSTDRAAEPS